MLLKQHWSKSIAEKQYYSLYKVQSIKMAFVNDRVQELR